MSFEIVIYGLAFGYDNTQDEERRELDNEEKEALDDEEFIDQAEQEGNVWTLNRFLRELETNNYGGTSDTDFYNMTLRAYMIHNASTFAPLRIDIPDLTFDSIDPNLETIGEPVREGEELVDTVEVQYVDYRPQNIKIIIDDEKGYLADGNESERPLIESSMRALAENLNALSTQDPNIFEELPIDEITQIICDTANQFDEFYITDDYEENYINVEVVTRETGILNDLDFMETEEDRTEYLASGEIDGDMSFYNKLGTSEFYFRLL